MAVGRAQRREQRLAKVQAHFDETETSAALDLLELTELGWHDVYGETTPPEEVVEDMLVFSGGTIDGLIGAAHLAVTDWRDLRLAADQLRGAN